MNSIIYILNYYSIPYTTGEYRKIVSIKGHNKYIYNAGWTLERFNLFSHNPDFLRLLISDLKDVRKL